MSDHPLLDSLNEQQRAAVTHYGGPALVIAGAGSGKTRTIVQRIAYLMAEHKVYPQQILAVTFTNKAAGELKERVEGLIGNAAKDLWVSTFHAACLRVLRTYGELIDLRPGFAIYDESDQLDLIKNVLESVPGLGDANPRVLRALIERAKSQLWSPQMLASSGEQKLGGTIAGIPLELLIEVYRRYQARLHRANAVDFSDILSRTVELFEAHPNTLDNVQQRAVFIHVDEYQDTNKVQYQLTRLLAEKYGNLMVVGDPDQGIYSFRGADVRNILDFQQDYEDANVYRLELNYRSTGRVLEVANAVILHNENRLEKELKPVKDTGERAKVYRAVDHRAEADFVARQVERLMAERAYGFDDFVVLYRTNVQSRVLEEAMRRASIPARIVGGVGFYERREVKDALSYARAALNPADDVAWQRILNRPKRGIGKTSLERLAGAAAKRGVRFVDALRAADEILKGTPAVARIANFLALMEELIESVDLLPAAEFLRTVLEESGYRKALEDEGSFEAQARLENLDELLNALSEWEEDGGGSIGEFLDEAALLASVDDRAVKAVNPDAPEQAVTLMTLHNAKGLEFPIVFLVGLEEELMPHRSSTGSLQEVEEERRLLYVGITRAQEELFFVHCESRMRFGRTEYTRPSRFLEDIPEGTLVDIDVFGRDLSDSGLNKFPRRTWRPPSIEVATGSTQITSFRGGEKVEHPRYGAGTVVGVSGEGMRAEITVVFDQGGAKRLMVKYSNLTTLP
ncbi:MAG: UvrD-helicase domain-containing protein [Trueperaceae bacterium]|nr:MAG: UvrD-helicase domain-containing protein [Trueperaceae bacterium]